jgi:hypothetical protein
MNCRNTTKPRGQRTRWWGKAAVLGATLALTGLQASAQIAMPYFENFSGIAAANGFPTVAGGAWTRTGTTTKQPTYIANQGTYNRTGNGDTKFMSFQYSQPAGGNVYVVGPFTLSTGVTYESRVLYKADGLTGFGPLDLTYGTGTTVALQSNVIASVPASITNLGYTELLGTFTVASSGSYYVGIKCQATSNPWYLTVDDFRFRVQPTCTSPVATTTVVPNCGSNQFSVDVNLTSLGDAATVDIVPSSGSPITGVSASGTYTVGPYASASSVSITVVHNGDNACNLSLGSSTYTCPQPGWTCAAPFVVSSFPYSGSSTTCGAINDYGIQCGGNYGGGEDFVYQLNIPTAGTYSINLTATGGGSYIGWFLKDGAGCTTAGTCLGNATSGSGTSANGFYNFTAAGTYYLIIDTWPSPACSAFNIDIAPPPACPAPVSAAATSITTSSALANWTTGGGSGTFLVEYGPSATFTTPGTGATAGVNGTVIDPATSPQLISGLAATTQYRYFVRQNCGIDGYSTNSAGQLFTTLAAPPANDDCSNAITIACASTPVTGSTNLSTVDAEYSDCGATGNNTTERGVWYKIVGDDNQYTITTCDAAPGYDTRLTVYSGSCGAFACVTANDDMTPSCTLGSFRSRVQFNANSGMDYYVFVHGYQFGTGLSATGNFVLNITCAPLCLPVPGNDICASATSLTVDAPALIGTNTCAAATVGNPSCESAFATLPDVFYSFTASPGGTNLITFNLYTATNLGYAIYSCQRPLRGCDRGELQLGDQRHDGGLHHDRRPHGLLGCSEHGRWHLVHGAGLGWSDDRGPERQRLRYQGRCVHRLMRRARLRG